MNFEICFKFKYLLEVLELVVIVVDEVLSVYAVVTVAVVGDVTAFDVENSDEVVSVVDSVVDENCEKVVIIVVDISIVAELVVNAVSVVDSKVVVA